MPAVPDRAAGDPQGALPAAPNREDQGGILRGGRCSTATIVDTKNAETGEWKHQLRARRRAHPPRVKFDKSVYVKRLRPKSVDKETGDHLEEIHSGSWVKEPTRVEPTSSTVIKSAHTHDPRGKLDRDTEHRIMLADQARALANEVKTKAFKKREWAQLKKDFDGMYRHCLIQNSKRGVDLVAPDESMIDPCRNI
ncbi:MAG: hypothetical protein QF745_03650, partial [Planctomycetota bacterium]|nr:hypothetical protein [Planctomycetota bacterium]